MGSAVRRPVIRKCLKAAQDQVLGLQVLSEKESVWQDRTWRRQTLYVVHLINFCFMSESIFVTVPKASHSGWRGKDLFSVPKTTVKRRVTRHGYVRALTGSPDWTNCLLGHTCLGLGWQPYPS